MTFTKYLSEPQDIHPIQLLQFEINELEKQRQELSKSKNTPKEDVHTTSYKWNRVYDGWNSHYSLVLHSNAPIKTVCCHSNTRLISIFPNLESEFSNSIIPFTPSINTPLNGSASSHVFQGNNSREKEFMIYTYPGHSFELDVFIILNTDPLTHYNFTVNVAQLEFFEPQSKDREQDKELEKAREMEEEYQFWIDISYESMSSKTLLIWIESAFSASSSQSPNCINFVWKSCRQECVQVQVKSIQQTLVSSNSPLVLCILKGIILRKAEEANTHLQLKCNVSRADLQEFQDKIFPLSHRIDILKELKAIQTQEKGNINYLDIQYQSLLERDIQNDFKIPQIVLENFKIIIQAESDRF